MICIECFRNRHIVVKSNCMFQGNSICDRCLIENHLQEITEHNPNYGDPYKSEQKK